MNNRAVLRLGVRLRVLSDEQMEDFHLASLEILSRTGIVLEHEGARELLAAAGAAVSGDGRVRIPPGLVKGALANAPERVLLYNRRDEPAVDLGADRSYFGTGSDTPTYVDPHSGEIKNTDRDSVREFARLCDALENIDFVMSMGIAKERPGTSSFVHQYAAMMEGSVKPIVYTAQGEKDIAPIYEIALAGAGDEALLRLQPRNLLYTEPVSPVSTGNSPLNTSAARSARRLVFSRSTDMVLGLSLCRSVPRSLMGLLDSKPRTDPLPLSARLNSSSSQYGLISWHHPTTIRSGTIRSSGTSS